MKLVFHIAGMLLVTLLLSGCPDSNLPKTPPRAPEPKTASTATMLSPVVLQTADAPFLVASVWAAL